MYSKEAREALLKSQSAWRDFVARSPGSVDLRSVNLSAASLAGRTFDSCDLSGARFSTANLDDASIRTSKLDAVDFSNASLVRASIDSVQMTNCVFTGAVLREAEFSRCRFTGCTFDGTSFMRAKFLDCELWHCSMLGSFDMDRTEFQDCEIDEWEVSNGRMVDCGFSQCMIASSVLHKHVSLNNTYDRCEIKGLRLVSCEMQKVAFRNCSIDGIQSEESVVCELDLSRSTVTRSHLSGIGLNSAILLGTAFVQCIWPKQVGRTTLLGRYVRSPDLISHPVQDVRSIGPTLRREIADAQYLAARLDMAQSMPSILLLRLWGFTSAYGQSIGRLLAMSCGVILIHGLLISFAEVFSLCEPVEATSLVESAWRATLLSAHAFIGLPQDDDALQLSPTIANVVVSARMWGFFALGIWISVAANKLSKLSAE